MAVPIDHGRGRPLSEWHVTITAHWHSIETVAKPRNVIPISLPVRDVANILDALDAFAREPNGGLVLPTDVTTIVNRDLIVALAARHRLAALYSFRSDVATGGLMSYGPDTANLFVRSASKIDRILKGAKPADLPVEGGGADAIRAYPPRRSALPFRRRCSRAQTK